MLSITEKYRGIHPGIVLERELKKRSIKQRSFALSIGTFPQTFNAIIKGKRNLPTSLALKIEEKLELNEGDLVLLQAYFDIKKEREKEDKPKPNLSVLRKTLFWDTEFDKIDWTRNYKAVIKRVFERGNEIEKNEIINFYGKDKISEALNSTTTLPMNLHF
jgi:plasmid maintenance system antidote protein VapI